MKKADFAEQKPGSGIWYKNNTDYTVSGISYDYNGNIQNMVQRGPGLDAQGAAVPVDMDNLTYTYAASSNKLSGVSEANNTVITTAPDFKDGTNSGDDYQYDANGNLTIDENKSIKTPITYTMQNKPLHIDVQGKGTIDYLYDALGNKLRSTVNQPAALRATTTDYCGPVIYENGNLKSILHSEGRSRPDPAAAANTVGYQYDYFVKDHLGNVRTVVNAKETRGISELLYQTDLEVGHANTDGLLWSYLDEVRDDKPDPTIGDTKAALLIGSDPAKRIGTAIMIKVMPGDKFKVSADSWYDEVSSEPPVSGQDVAGSLLSALAGGSLFNGHTVAEADGNVQLINSAFGGESFASAYDGLTAQDYDPARPPAYLNYMVMDEHLHVMDGSGVLQVSGAGGSWNANETADAIEIGTSGYLTVWTANKGTSSVYFDKVKLMYYKGDVLEENHYYPFGLTLSANNGTPAEMNNYKLTTKELQDDFGLNFYDFGARAFDMQRGQWIQHDPLSEQFSDITPYNYVHNNPTRRIDPTGMGDGEFEKGDDGRWLKVSAKGDKIGIDFYHTESTNEKGRMEQNTFVTDRKGNWNVIHNGRQAIQGIERSSNVGWSNIYNEWHLGVGPTSSVFEGAHPANKEIQGYGLYQRTLFDFWESKQPKKGYEIGMTPLLDNIGAGNNMQIQMMGSFNASFYKLGESILTIINDSKSKSSFYYHLPVDNYERNTKRNEIDNSVFDNGDANTYQNYFFIQNYHPTKWGE